MKWWGYVQGVAGDAKQDAIADKVGVDKSAVTRWKSGSGVQAIFAVKFARAYGRPVTEALAAAGVITEAEATETVSFIQGSVEQASNAELVNELHRRLEGESVANVSPLRKDREDKHLKAVAMDSRPPLNENEGEV